MAETLFGTGTPGGLIHQTDSLAVTLGMRVLFSDPVVITKVRFYKTDSTDSGTHIGAIWDSAGTLLSQATYSGETSTGWQEATLPSVLSVAAGYYVVGTYHPNGNYGKQDGVFTTTPVVAASGGWLSPMEKFTRGNGVYKYGSDLQFPDQIPAGQPWYGEDLELEHGDWPSSLLLDKDPASTPNDGPYTLGTRFTTDVRGRIVGVRFYHNINEVDGTVTVLLYDGGGNQLASKTASMSAQPFNGWYRVDFDTPVWINPGTTYTVAQTVAASYVSTNGFYATSYDRAPLHSPVTAGRFNAGAVPTYPTSSFNNTSYFVDPVFVTERFSGWGVPLG